jgi:uncharacterized protein YjbI with pentapeptide repeats
VHKEEGEERLLECHRLAGKDLMIAKHDRREERTHTFDQVWERLNDVGAQQLTTRAGTAFVAKAAITTRGNRKGEPVIRYFQHGQEYGRCYECCWEHYYNCNRTRIGMYSKAVDEWMGSGTGARKLTRHELLKLIEENGGPQGLDLSGRDLSGLKLGGDAIRAEMRASGISESHDAPGWVYIYRGEPAGINLQEVVLDGANLQGAILLGANLQRAQLEDANLQGAILALANLQEAKLWDANLRGAILPGANLQGAHLYNCNLQGAILVLANLQEALVNSANLQGAHLDHASLREVDFTSVHALEETRWYRARFDRTNMTRDKLGHAIGEEKQRDYYRAKESYLALKNNFESIGRYEDASWAYVKERKMEKMTNHPRHARRYYAKQENLTHSANWRSARLWGFYLRHIWKWIMDWAAELVCSYGESIPRVIVTLAVVYAAFTLGYGLTWSVMRVTTSAEGVTRVFTGNPLDWAIFSLGALTTMDAVGLEPRNCIVQLFAGLEALVGIFLTGLLGFVVANRIRRS